MVYIKQRNRYSIYINFEKKKKYCLYFLINIKYYWNPFKYIRNKISFSFFRVYQKFFFFSELADVDPSKKRCQDIKFCF